MGGRASEVMTAEVHHVAPGSSLAAAHEQMQRLGVRHLPVLSEGALVGMLSDRDVLLAATRDQTGYHYPPVTVREVMSPAPKVVAVGASLQTLARTLLEHGISSLPVQGEDGALVGLVTSSDLLRLLAREEEHLANDRTLDAVQELIESENYRSAALRLGELRVGLEQHLDAEARLVPIFVVRTGDPQHLGARLQQEHQRLPECLEAVASAITHWERAEALAALRALREAFREHERTELELLHPALDDLVDEEVDWGGLRHKLTAAHLAP